MSGLNYELLKQVKKAFVDQPGAVDPSMAGGMPPMDPSMAGGMPPVDPSMMGADPSMMGIDPSMAGGMPPMDPSMMGAVPPPPPGLDPAMAGQVGAPEEVPQQNSMISMTTDEFMKFIKQLVALITNAAKGNNQADAPAPAPSLSPDDSGKLDRIIGMLNGSLD